MNILLAVSIWPNLYTTYFFHELAELQRRGHNVVLVSVSRNSSANTADLRHFGLDDLPVTYLEGNFNDEASLQRVKRLIDREHVEVMYAQTARDAAELALRLHEMTGLPYIVRLNGGDIHSKPWPRLDEILYHASAICPLSPFLADLLLRKKTAATSVGVPLAIDPAKIHICPYGVPGEAIATEPAAQSDERQLVGTIGRLGFIKRQDDILEAAATLISEYPNLSVRLIGGGELQEPLERRAYDLRISERTEITGPLQWPEVMRKAKELSIYVQTSEREGFCVATVEAAAQGLPLILSRTGIHEECVVDGLNGYLFSPGDVVALCNYLRQTLSSGAEKRKQMGAVSLEIVRNKFRLERTTLQIENVLKAVG